MVSSSNVISLHSSKFNFKAKQVRQGGLVYGFEHGSCQPNTIY